MPRAPRNSGSGKAPVNTPASGPGWGGDAKGASTAPENLTPFQRGNPGPANWPDSEWRRWKEERARLHLEHVDYLARNAEMDQTRLAASLAFYQTVHGRPKQETENTGETTLIIKTGVPRAERD